jgi:hypothetical protein
MHQGVLPPLILLTDLLTTDVDNPGSRWTRPRSTILAAISLDDLRRSLSLVIALPRVDDCLVPQSTAVEGSGHLLARAVIIPWAAIPAA